MKNIQELRDSLLSNIKEIKSGDLPVKEAEAITNTAGKVLNTVLAELKYSEMRQEKPEIEFLMNDKQIEIRRLVEKGNY